MSVRAESRTGKDLRTLLDSARSDKILNNELHY